MSVSGALGSLWGGTKSVLYAPVALAKGGVKWTVGDGLHETIQDAIPALEQDLRTRLFEQVPEKLKCIVTLLQGLHERAQNDPHLSEEELTSMHGALTMLIEGAPDLLGREWKDQEATPFIQLNQALKIILDSREGACGESSPFSERNIPLPKDITGCISSALETSIHLLQEKTGLLPEVTAWFEAFITDFTKKASLTYLSCKESLAPLIATQNPSKAQVETAFQTLVAMAQTHEKELSQHGEIPSVDIQEIIRAALKILNQKQDESSPQLKGEEQEIFKQAYQLVESLIQERQGQLQNTLDTVFTSIIHPERGLVSQLTRQLDLQVQEVLKDNLKQSPPFFMKLLSALRCMLGIQPTQEMAHQARNLLQQARETPRLCGLDALQEEEQCHFEEGLKVLATLLEDEEPLSIPSEHLDILRSLTERLNQVALSQSGKVSAAILGLQDVMLHEESGMVRRTIDQTHAGLTLVKEEFSAFVADQLKQAKEPLLTLFSSLQRLQGPKPSQEDLAMACRSLDHLKKHPQELIGREWKEGETRRIEYLIEELDEYQKDQKPVDAPLLGVLEQVSTHVHALIQENQGPIFAGVDALFQHVLDPRRGLVQQALDQLNAGVAQLTVELTKEEHPLLEKAHADLSELSDVLVEANPREEILPYVVKVQKALQEITENSPEHVLQLKGFPLRKAMQPLSLLLEMLHLYQAPLMSGKRPSLQDLQSALREGKEMVQTCVRAQQGTVPRVIDVATDRLQRQMERRMDHVSRRFTSHAAKLVNQGKEMVGFSPSPSHPLSSLLSLYEQEAPFETFQEELMQVVEAIDSKYNTHTQKPVRKQLSELTTREETLFVVKVVSEQMHHVLEKSPEATNTFLYQTVYRLAQERGVDVRVESEQHKIELGQKYALEDPELFLKAFVQVEEIQESIKKKSQSSPSHIPPLSSKSSPSQVDTGSGLLSRLKQALSFFSNIPSGVATASFSMLSGTIIGWLQKTSQWIAEYQGLSSDQKKHIQKILTQGISLLQEAQKGDSVTSYLDAVRYCLDELSHYPIIINGFEIPAMTTIEPKPSAIEAQSHIIESLQATLPSQEEEVNWTERADEQKERFIQNTSFISTYNFVKCFCSEEIDDTVFSEIMTQIRHLPSQEQIERFSELLQDEINQKAGFFSKYFLRLILPTTHWVIQFVIRLFSNNVTTYLREEIQQSQDHPIRAIHLEPIKRMIHFLSGYQKGLKLWAYNPTGNLDREDFLEEMLRRPEFNHNFSAEELHQETVNVAVDDFLPELELSSFMTKQSAALNAWALKDTFTPDTPLKIVGNFCLAVTSWIAINLPVQFFLLWGKLTLMGVEFLANFLGKWALKKIIITSDVMNTVAGNARSSLYEDSPYTYAIDCVILDQLKAIWELMRHPDQVDLVEQEPGQLVGLTRQLVKQLFETLEKRKFETEEQLKQYLEKKTSLLESMAETGRSLILPDIISSVVDIVMVAYQSVLERDQMEKQLFNFFSTMNEAIDSEITPRTREEQKAFVKQCEHTQRMIYHYTDNILRVAVNRAIDEKVSEFGTSQKKMLDAYVDWLKVTLLGAPNQEGYLRLWEDALHVFERHESLASLDAMKEQCLTFMREFQSKTREMEANYDFKERSRNFIKDTSRMLTEEVSHFHDSFIQLYRNEQSCAFHQKIAAPLRVIDYHFKSIQGAMQGWAEHGFNPSEEHPDRISSYLALIEDQVHVHLDPLEHVSPPLSALILKIKTSLRTIQEETSRLRSLPQVLQLTLRIHGPSSSLLQEVLSLKIQDRKHACEHASSLSKLTHDFSPIHMQFEEKLKSLKSLIHQLPQETDQLFFIELLSPLQNSRISIQQCEEIQQRMIQRMDQINRSLQTNIRYIQTSFFESQHEIEASIKALLQSWKEDTHTNRSQNQQLIEESRKALCRLRKTTEDTQKIPTISFDAIDTSGISQGVKGFVFKELRERAYGFFDLCRDKVAFEYIMRNLVELNLVESLGEPRVRLSTNSLQINDEA